MMSSGIRTESSRCASFVNLLRIGTSALLMLGSTTLLGCGDDATSTPDGTVEITVETLPLPDTTEVDAIAMNGEIEGRWAMLETQTALVTTQILGTQVQTSVSYYLADFAAGKLSVTLCDWLTDDDAHLTTTRMGDKVLASLTPLVRTYNVTPAGNGFAFEAKRGYALRGVALEHIDTDPMPTEAADPTVLDQDTDGQPGITLVVQGTITGQLYVAHRHIAALSGALESDTRISGLTEWTTEQSIFGSEPALLAAQKPVAITHPDADKSHFVMVKVAGSDTCASINAARPTLFP